MPLKYEATDIGNRMLHKIVFQIDIININKINILHYIYNNGMRCYGCVLKVSEGRIQKKWSWMENVQEGV